MSVQEYEDVHGDTSLIEHRKQIKQKSSFLSGHTTLKYFKRWNMTLLELEIDDMLMKNIESWTIMDKWNDAMDKWNDDANNNNLQYCFTHINLTLLYTYK